MINLNGSTVLFQAASEECVAFGWHQNARSLLFFWCTLISRWVPGFYCTFGVFDLVPTFVALTAYSGVETMVGESVTP